MIDFHSHVLPGMDDGSKSVEESLAMLEVSAGQGISYMAATSHFYPMENSPERFLARRAAAVERLRCAWKPGLPELLLGAEVYFFEGMSGVQELDALRLEGTELLMVEMPFSPWTERMVKELLAVHERRGITVMLAHIERYFRYQPKGIWDDLRDRGILMQSNAEFFLSWRTKRKACRMLAEGKIHLLGSDSHNMSARPPRLGEALSVVGEPGRRKLEKNIRRLVPSVEGK